MTRIRYAGVVDRSPVPGGGNPFHAIETCVSACTKANPWCRSLSELTIEGQPESLTKWAAWGCRWTKLAGFMQRSAKRSGPPR